NVRENHNKHYPDTPMLSFEQVQNKVQDWSGVFPIKKDMCFKSCIAYTRPFENLESCPIC
ncbi:hypothetical protein M422DRAFT_80570, partial [Sphaerobolus stellatus SS14]